MLRERLEAALTDALGDGGEAVELQCSAEERDGMLLVTLRAECREEIGRFVPAADSGEEPSKSDTNEAGQ